MRRLRTRSVFGVPCLTAIWLGFAVCAAAPRALGEGPGPAGTEAPSSVPPRRNASPPPADPPADACSPDDDALAALRLATARLARQRTPRPWTRADNMLVSIDALCEAARTSWATCPDAVRTPGRAAAADCSRATQHVWEAIQQEEDIRAGRRELRRLPQDDRDRDYSYLVGQYEHRQMTALQALPATVDAFAQHLAEFAATRDAADHATRIAIDPALDALRAAHEQLRRMNVDIQRAIAPPPARSSRGR